MTDCDNADVPDPRLTKYYHPIVAETPRVTVEDKQKEVVSLHSGFPGSKHHPLDGLRSLLNEVLDSRLLRGGDSIEETMSCSEREAERRIKLYVEMAAVAEACSAWGRSRGQ